MGDHYTTLGTRVYILRNIIRAVHAVTNGAVVRYLWVNQQVWRSIQCEVVAAKHALIIQVAHQKPCSIRVAYRHEVALPEKSLNHGKR